MDVTDDIYALVCREGFS